MIEKEVEIINRLGLHARAAAKLVHTAGRFDSEVTIAKGAEEVDGKSILGVLLLAAPQGSEVKIRCSGNDEGEAMEALICLFADRFQEES